VGVLFGEAQGRIVISCDPARTAEVLRLASRYEVPARRIGTVTAAAEGFSIALPDASVRASMAAMVDAYFESLGRVMDAPATEA
jgi:phosphoribosylformylglycinamidine (FGAM) synthase-like enzyme